MAIQDTLIALREQHGLTQSELAERLFVTRQAVSRWECGETQPGIETLKLIATEFHVPVEGSQPSISASGATRTAPIRENARWRTWWASAWRT